MKVTVVTNPGTRVSINKQQRELVRVTGASGASGSVINKLAQLVDVDASDPNNNETIVYDDVSGKYVVKTLPIINGGTF